MNERQKRNDDGSAALYIFASYSYFLNDKIARMAKLDWGMSIAIIDVAEKLQK